MRLTLFKQHKRKVIQKDFDTIFEVTNYLKCWPQEVRVALNNKTKVKGYFVEPTTNLEKSQMKEYKTRYVLTIHNQIYCEI